MKGKSFLHKPFPIALFLLFLPFTASADLANPFTGSYYGSVTIESPTPDMATVDLAFYLDVEDDTGQLIQGSSCIRLDKTMLFPEVDSPLEIRENRNGEDVLVESIEAGPRMIGTFSEDTFSIASNPSFVSIVGDKEVSREIVLDNAIVDNEGQFITGTYTETVTGLLVDAVTIRGTFILLKPVSLTVAIFEDSSGDGCLDLDEIRAGGDDPAKMEFRDASGAVSLFNNRGPGVTQLCVPADQTVRDAVQEFYNEQ